MTEVTKEMIEAGGRFYDEVGLIAAYLAMRERDPEFARLKYDSEDLCDAANGNLDSLLEARAALAEALEIMKPFAQRADDWKHNSDNARPGVKLAHLRAASAFVEKHSKGGDAK